jgi:hypothetical protein
MESFSITDAADQQFGAVLNRRRVTMRLRYNTTIDRWAMDLAIDDLPVLHGRRIVIGADLLRAFDFGIGIVIAAAPGAKPEEPGRRQLVDGRVRLYHTTEDERDEAVSA